MVHHHSGMDMDMSMGSMSTGNGIPALGEFPKIYLGLVGGVVGIAAIANVIDILICRQRLAAARNGQLTPSKPKSLPAKINATATAIAREAQNATLDPIKIWRFHIRMPTVGRVSLIVANIIVLIVLCFVGFHDTRAYTNFENIGYRTGFVSLAQIPLLFLLAGKNNIIGFLTGMSYERINWLHRWCARCLLLTSTIHFGYWLSDWWPYGSFVAKKIRTDPLTYRGVIAWVFLVWIVFSSMAPIRGWSYEFFVIQHLMTFAVFIGMVYIHTPAECHVYIWIPVGLFFFDRVRREGKMKGFWACKAEFTSLSQDTMRVTINNPPISWNAGQHVFLSCHSLVPLQSHPFTIASIPEDGKIEFYIKAQKGATKKFSGHAEKMLLLPNSQAPAVRSVAIEGPYGRIRPLRQFDSVVFFAGSTGATFTMPLLRDIVAGWKQGRIGGTWMRPAGVVTRHVRFVWVVKSRGQLSWFASQLSTIINDVARLHAEGLDIDVDMSVYCTCDDEFTEEHKSVLQSLGYMNVKQTVTTYGKGNGQNSELVSENSMSEKDILKKRDELETTIQEVESQAESSFGEGPRGATATCCCTANIEDEDEIKNDATPCCCGVATEDSSRHDSLSSSRESTSGLSTKKVLIHPEIALFAGRPTPRNIIRKTLEQALGESAVVCCGPQGLVDGVRNAVVRLSDERAVHKGTGAQGIYVHCESFNNGPGCLAKTPTTKDPRDSAPPPQITSLPKDYWSRSTRKKQQMDARSPFRGGGGMQVHAVPDGERATVNGQQLPWAYEYADPDRTARLDREKGPFGRSTRTRRTPSRSKTATPSSRAQDKDTGANWQAIDDIFTRAKEADGKEQQRASSTPAIGAITAPETPQTSPVGQPTEAIIYGFPAAFQYAAIEFYERVSQGAIYEDYDRFPAHTKYDLSLSLRQARGSGRISQEALRKKNQYDGGEHWIKVTFDSAEAAERACYYSPHIIKGYLVYAEPYRGSGPTNDEAILATPAAVASATASPSQRSSATLQNHTPGLSPSVTASSATATTTLHDPFAPVAPSPLAQSVTAQTPNSSFGQSTALATEQRKPPRIRGAKRAVLLPVESALLPSTTTWQKFANVPIVNLFIGNGSDIIGHQVPRKEDGTFDWDNASVYWRFWWCVDYYCWTDWLGLKSDD
ncbi:ferric-chelate reductase [Venturia nashicola]|nr:ferric-chelate reductase [Venturia nashicola]